MYNFIRFKELDSTNTYAKNNFSTLKDGDVVVADYQTAGHGRMSRSWHGSNDSIAFSIIYKNEFVLSNFASLSLISACAVFLTLKEYMDNVYLKWPNDVIVNGHKISGILLESISYDKLDTLILGIGVNINNENFPKELNATSMYLECGHKFDKELILQKILSNIDYLLNDIKNHHSYYLELFRENNYLLNKEVHAQINGKDEIVKIIDILDNNQILVELNGKKISLCSGELTFHK